jgi:hypothetical protein
VLVASDRKTKKIKDKRKHKKKMIRNKIKEQKRKKKGIE